MKKLAIIIGLLMLGGCYQNTVDSFSTFNFQMIVKINATYLDRAVPDQSLDFSNLNKYEEYHKNKDRIKKSQLLQFNYWIDSLVLDNNQPYDPNKDLLQLDYIIYTLVFARPIAGNENSENPADFEPDPTIPEYELGRFTNVNIRDYYRKAHNIKEIPKEISDQISEHILRTPYFYIKTTYGNVAGSLDKYRFPLIKANFNLNIRFTVDLKE